MDKKYKAIKTINQLNLSGRPSSSLSSISGKSDFSNVSAEKRFNEAYAKDFSITPPKKVVKEKILPIKLSPLKLLTLPAKPAKSAKQGSIYQKWLNAEPTSSVFPPETKTAKDKTKSKKLGNLYQEYLDKKWVPGIPVDGRKTEDFYIDRVQRNLLTHIKDEKIIASIKKQIKEIKAEWKKPPVDPDLKFGFLYPNVSGKMSSSS